MQSNKMSELLLLTYLEGATDSPLRHTKSHPSYYITNIYVHQIYYNTHIIDLQLPSYQILYKR